MSDVCDVVLDRDVDGRSYKQFNGIGDTVASASSRSSVRSTALRRRDNSVRLPSLSATSTRHVASSTSPASDGHSTSTCRRAPDTIAGSLYSFRRQYRLTNAVRRQTTQGVVTRKTTKTDTRVGTWSPWSKRRRAARVLTLPQSRGTTQPSVCLT